MAEIRAVAVAISLLNAASHPVFLAVHNCRSARCGQTRFCSALSRLGIYVFSWGVYPLLIMLLANPSQVIRASEHVSHAYPRICMGRNEWEDLGYVGDGNYLGMRVGWWTGFVIVMSVGLR